MFLADDIVAHLSEVVGAPQLGGTKYRILGPLGRGGMATVYRAEDAALGREVAVKVSLELGSPALAARLVREAEVIARLEHPSIVPVHDVGTLPDGRVFYVMKLVRGARLDAWARAEPRLRSRLRMFQRVCEAIAFAHAHGVLHRDIKPENVMVGEFGEALVMDWGIAKELGRAPLDESLAGAAPDALADTLPATNAATARGDVMGTPAYMAPEQARGDIDSLDARTDVYALGGILYYLLALRPPFSGSNLHEVLAKVHAEMPTPLRDVDRDIPRPLAAACMKAMAKSPDDRYPTALALSSDVGSYLDEEPLAAYRENALERIARFTSRHRTILSLLAAYLVLRALLALFLN